MQDQPTGEAWSVRNRTELACAVGAVRLAVY
jgi:hypothetical protein